MKWILIIVAVNSLPLHFGYENHDLSPPPFQVQWSTIEGFESKKTCEYAAKWFHEQLRRETKCIHQ